MGRGCACFQNGIFIYLFILNLFVLVKHSQKVMKGIKEARWVDRINYLTTSKFSSLAF